MLFTNKSIKIPKQLAMGIGSGTLFLALLSQQKSQAATFYDVPDSYTFANEINELARRGVISGFEDGSFKPNIFVNRGQLAKFINRGFDVQAPIGPQQGFSDVPLSHTFYEDIMDLKGAGVINGYGDGTFKPDNFVTRGELSKFIFNAAKLLNPDKFQGNNTGGSDFSDVGSNNTFYTFIKSLKNLGIINGYGDGSYKPDQYVTRGELSKFIINAFSQPSIVFRDYGEIKIPGIDHVGFAFNDYVYESNQAYAPGDYLDKNTGLKVKVEENGTGVKPGVKKELTLGSWNYLNGKTIKSLPQPFTLDYNLAKTMASLINGKIGAGYSNLNPFAEDGGISPGIQKGGLGAYTCVGIIEWAAEQVSSYNAGQGFIRNDLEYIDAAGGRYSTLTPSLLYHALHNSTDFNKGGLHGLLDPVDFILTDPLGRRLGYTQQLGLLNEIPEAFYTGDGWAEQFFVSGLAPGNYALQLFGLDDEAKVAFGNSTGGSYFSGYLAKGETKTLTFAVPGPSEQVPEPTTVLGTLAFGVFVAGILRNRNKAKLN